MRDPFVIALAAGLAASVGAGRALVYTLEIVPERWRRAAQWLFIGAAAAIAIFGDLLSNGPGAQGALVFLIAVLPGILTYLVFRTMLASAIVSFVPLYFVLTAMTSDRPMHTPYIALDSAFPLQPAWMVVYGSLYMFVALLPFLVVRGQGLARRSMQAYLFVMFVAYIGFLLYPTTGPRPALVPGDGFFPWALRLLYQLDTPRGCFPSLHVAYSFVSALSCYRVHKRVGVAALVWATLIGLSTLYTKQHYVVDVIAGTGMGVLAYVIFLRGYPRELIDHRARQEAPRRAMAVVWVSIAALGLFWVIYRTNLIGPI